MVFKAVSILVTLELAAVLFQCPNLSLAKVLVSNSNTEQQKLTLFEVSVHICYSIRVLLYTCIQRDSSCNVHIKHENWEIEVFIVLIRKLHAIIIDSLFYLNMNSVTGLGE